MTSVRNVAGLPTNPGETDVAQDLVYEVILLIYWLHRIGSRCFPWERKKVGSASVLYAGIALAQPMGIEMRRSAAATAKS